MIRARVQERIDRACDAVRPFSGVAREVGELAEDDIHADGVDEADHDRMRHESQDRSKPEEPGAQHHDASQDRKREQRASRIGRSVDRVDVRDDHRHGPGPLDGHEDRAGRERTDHRADKVGIEASDRVDAGQQPDRKAVRDALHAKDDAGYGVLAQ